MAINEAWVLDSLALNDGVTFTIEAVDATPPPELEEWVKGADSDGSLLVREPKLDNRTITMSVRVEPQASMNLALAKVALIVDKLKECQRNPNGLALTWVPANSTLPTVTFRCLSGQVAQMPIDVQNGWLVNAPLLSLKLTCLPLGEGTESQVATVTSSAPIIVLPDITALGGDVPALGRLVVTDAASKDRRYVAWGLESRYYPTAGAPSLIVDSSGMVTVGFAGVTATRTAAYSSATNNVIGVTVRQQAQAVCGLGNLSHVGSFRPQLRFWASATTIALRLSWKALDGPSRSLSYKIPVAVGFNHVDLGLITVPPADAGTQRWTGQIEVYSTSTGGETFQVDALWLMPAEMYGRARATYSYSPGALVAYDDFNSMTALAALNARVALVGGTWATSGAATDYVAHAVSPSGFKINRNTGADTGVGRFAVLGATNYTNVEAGTWITFATQSSLTFTQALVVRWVDASNYLELSVSQPTSGSSVLQVAKVVAGARTVLVSSAVQYTGPICLRLVVFASGAGYATVFSSSASLPVPGSLLTSMSFVDAALATGGALATGKPGLRDFSAGGGAPDRDYDNFYAATPPPEPIALYSTRTIEFRDDDTLRQDSTGTYYGQPPEYVGARFKVPNAGGPGRKTRVAVIARWLDVETSNDDDLVSNATTDSTTVTAFATPRYLVVPR